MKKCLISLFVVPFILLFESSLGSENTSLLKKIISKCSQGLCRPPIPAGVSQMSLGETLSPRAISLTTFSVPVLDDFDDPQEPPSFNHMHEFVYEKSIGLPSECAVELFSEGMVAAQRIMDQKTLREQFVVNTVPWEGLASLSIGEQISLEYDTSRFETLPDSSFHLSIHGQFLPDTAATSGAHIERPHFDRSSGAELPDPNPCGDYDRKFTVYSRSNGKTDIYVESIFQDVTANMRRVLLSDNNDYWVGLTNEGFLSQSLAPRWIFSNPVNSLYFDAMSGVNKEWGIPSMPCVGRARFAALYSHSTEEQSYMVEDVDFDQVEAGGEPRVQGIPDLGSFLLRNH